MVGFALLGAWHVHADGFVRDALKTGAGELKAVWDEDEARGSAFAQKYGVPYTGNLDEVLAREDVDAVMVECPTTRHKEVILKAARAGKQIFSDKALALTVADCLEIKQALAENGVKFTLSLESKAIGAYRYAKKLADEGALGRITSVYFRRAHQAALDPNMLPSYWFDTAQTGGGATLDLGCHGLYLLPHFCGAPKKVTSMMNELYGTGGDEISTTVIEFESGAVGTAHTSFACSKLDNLFEVIGTEGILVVSGMSQADARVLLQSNRLPGYENLSPVPAEELLPDAEMPSAQFVRMVDGGAAELPEFDIDKAVMLTRLIECAYESARSGRTVLY